ncbi:MAG: DUF3090 family protein, partial [Chloroflexi bacterium]|nr:DUF3090 family protein [Chloroflexota bacterium]
MSPQYDFPAVTHLVAGARGEPGKRTFYLEAGDVEQWVRTWLEKEVLQALAEAIDQLLASLAQQRNSPQPTEAAPAEPRSDEPAAEFRAGRLALGYDEARG